MFRCRTVVSTTLFVAFASVPALAQGVYFMGLGDLDGGNFNSQAYGISADGSWVAGASNSFDGGFGGEEQAFRWSPGTGMVGLGDLPGDAEFSHANAISPDGAFVVGVSNSSFAAPEAFLWSEAGGMIGLGDLPGGLTKSRAYGVSRDGSVVVGNSHSYASGDLGAEAFRWTAEEGMVGMGDLPGGSFSSGASAVSADGSVIAGSGSSDRGNEAFRWTESEGMVALGDLDGSLVRSQVFGMSDNGAFIVGQGLSDDGPEAFLWSEDDGMIGLGDLSGGIHLSNALDVSDDGSVVVGVSLGEGSIAFLWERGKGMRRMEDVLLDYGIDISEYGWFNLQSATGVSADGRTIIGFGAGPNGPEAWIAHIPTPGTLAPLAGLGLLGMRRRR